MSLSASAPAEKTRMSWSWGTPAGFQLFGLLNALFPPEPVHCREAPPAVLAHQPSTPAANRHSKPDFAGAPRSFFMSFLNSFRSGPYPALILPADRIHW